MSQGRSIRTLLERPSDVSMQFTSKWIVFASWRYVESTSVREIVEGDLKTFLQKCYKYKEL